jgi:excinuclease ABC subunit B
MMSERELANEISRLEKQMMAEAKNLEFEKAATTRDQIAKIKELAFGALAKDSI